MGSIGSKSVSRTPYQEAMQESSIPKRQKALKKLMNDMSVGESLPLNSVYSLQKGRDDIFQLFNNGNPEAMKFRKEWLDELTATKTRKKYL